MVVKGNHASGFDEETICLVVQMTDKKGKGYSLDAWLRYSNVENESLTDVGEFIWYFELLSST